MCRLLHRCFAVLALLCVGASTIFSVQIGFLCRCGPAAILTHTAHCHGEESAACSEHQHEHDSAPLSQEGLPQDHEEIRSEFLWSPLAKGAGLPPVVGFEIDTFLQPLAPLPLRTPAATRLDAMPIWRGPPGTLGLLAVRSTVRLI